MNRLSDGDRANHRAQRLRPDEIIREATRRRKRATKLILLAVPIAIGGFFLGVILDPMMGRENAGLVMAGGMVATFLLLGRALHIYRCPSCGKVPGRWTTSSHYRVWFTSERCEQCDAVLRD
ncbi:MAG: hypothetical protein RLN89_08970 [Parvibaculum sp.]